MIDTSAARRYADLALEAREAGRGFSAASAKLERLMEILPELFAEGRRILLFSQLTSMLALIEEALGTAGIAHVSRTGRTRDRTAPVERFRSGEAPAFLISLKAGGTGLNLTAADTVARRWLRRDRAHDRPSLVEVAPADRALSVSAGKVRGRSRRSVVS